jgi:hypothetical protein
MPNANANAVRSARLLLYQESKDDDAVAVKPMWLLVYFIRGC